MILCEQQRKAEQWRKNDAHNENTRYWNQVRDFTYHSLGTKQFWRCSIDGNANFFWKKSEFEKRCDIMSDLRWKIQKMSDLEARDLQSVRF